MPRVPTYDDLQATPAALPQAQFRAAQPQPVAGDQAQQMGRALLSSGSVAARIAADMQEEANRVRVREQDDALANVDLQYRTEAAQLKGKAALDRPDKKSLPDEFDERLVKVGAELREQLGNGAQKSAFDAALARRRLQLRQSMTSHMLAEQQTYYDETDRESIRTAQARGATLWGDKAALAEETAKITQTIDGIAKRKGWDQVVRDGNLVQAMSPMHASIVREMVRAGYAVDARKYYEDNAGAMTLEARGQLQTLIQGAADAQIGEQKANAAWAAVGPKGLNDGVRVFDMERLVREELKDNPEAMKVALSGIRERARAFNEQQAETNATNLNQVAAQIVAKVPMAQTRKSDAWMALPATKQKEVEDMLQREAESRERMAAARESRAAAAEARQQQQLLLHNAQDYLRHSDPEVLRSMSRQQVEALYTKFGFDGARHLVGRWDQLQSIEGKLQAGIDQDLFNVYAERLGLKPFDNNKTPKEKEQLGVLKYRVENLISGAQAAKKAPLSYQEKEELIRGELSRTVTVDTWGWNNKQVPVIALTPDEASNVMIPLADQQRLKAILRKSYDKDSSNPLFAPTEANLRRMYLMERSRAGELLSGQ